MRTRRKLMRWKTRYYNAYILYGNTFLDNHTHNHPDEETKSRDEYNIEKNKLESRPACSPV